MNITSFTQMKLIMDNLLNCEEEPEDVILADSAVLERLIAQARQEPCPTGIEAIAGQVGRRDGE